MDEISKLEALKGAEANEAKKVLANEVTTLCHGNEAARDSSNTAEKTFVTGELDRGLPSVDIPSHDLRQGISAFELLVRVGLAKSNGEARRLIRGGGARLNDDIIEDETRKIGKPDLSTDGLIKLSVGKKRHVLVRTNE